MGKAIEFISKTPVPVCGLALALASLDIFLYQQYDFYTFRIFALISAILVILFTLKAVLSFSALRTEIGSPVPFGVLPTYSMALMLLSTIAYRYIGQAAVVIWAVAIILSFAMIVFFVKNFVLKFDIRNVFPSWFVMFIGFVVASVASPTFGMETIGKILLFVGLAMYFVVTPLILYRIIMVKGIPESAVPNAAIFAATMNLCIVGYFATFGIAGVSGAAIAVMAAIGIASYVAVLLSMPSMLRIKFYPSYAAFTFPLVISMVSIQKLGAFYGILHDSVFSAVQTITVIIAVLIVVYVLIRFLMMFYGIAKGLNKSAPA